MARKPTSQQPQKASSDSLDDVIDRLYDVAIDPLRYEELLDHWEAMIAPYRQAVNAGDMPFADDAVLRPHLARAEKVLDKMTQRTRAMSPKEVIAAIDHNAAFTINTNVRISRVNRAAKKSFGIRRNASLDDLPLDSADLTSLDTMVRQLLRANSDQPAVMRARLADQDRMVVFHIRRAISGQDKPYLVVVSSELYWPEGFGELLRSAFGLTEAECQVVRGLTECQSLKEIAQTRGRSVETIRAQLRAVMGKTETRSQSELVRLTLSTMEITAFTESASALDARESRGFDALTPRPFHAHRLRDGRLLEYLVLGDWDGQPVLYLPNDFGLIRWPAAAENAAAERGLKIIAPVRAGYGASDEMPSVDDLGRAIGEDILSLLDALEVKRCPVLSQGGDFHFVAHICALDPKRFSHAIACSGVLPYTRPEQYERMDKWHRFILAGARYTPHLLPFMVKAGFALARRIGKRGFIHAIYGGSPADLATFRKPDVQEAMLCGTDITLSDQHSAHDAFAREIIAQETVDWSNHVRAMEGHVDVTFLNGLNDPQTSPETLDEFEADYPWIDFQRVPNAGQLLFFDHWEAVLDMLDRGQSVSDT